MFKQEKTLSHTGSAVISAYRSERLLDCALKVESNLVDKIIQSLVVEDSLHFREYCLNRIEFRTISHVPYRGDLQIIEVALHSYCLVDGCIIHEQSERLAIHLLMQCLKIVYEVICITRRILNLYMKDASILCNRGDHIAISLAYLLLIDCEV